MDGKLFRVSSEDVKRIDKMIERIFVETEKLGMKKLKQSIVVRALIFCGEHIENERLIEAVKKAYICA